MCMYPVLRRDEGVRAGPTQDGWLVDSQGRIKYTNPKEAKRRWLYCAWRQWLVVWGIGGLPKESSGDGRGLANHRKPPPPHLISSFRPLAKALYSPSPIHPPILPRCCIIVLRGACIPQCLALLCFRTWPGDLLQSRSLASPQLQSLLYSSSSSFRITLPPSTSAQYHTVIITHLQSTCRVLLSIPRLCAYALYRHTPRPPDRVSDTSLFMQYASEY